MSLNITVITADIIDSRESAVTTNDLKYKLAECISPALLTPIKMSRGDEIQAVAAGWLMAPEIIRYLRYLCRPLKLRIGIGTGIVEKPLGFETDPWSLNGPAFYLAREALDEIKAVKIPATRVKIGSKGLEQYLNCIYTLVDDIQNGWTDRQWEAVHLYEKAGTYEEAGKLLGIAYQNVEKRCKAARWNKLQNAEDVLKTTESFLEIISPCIG